jgi:hypothetical protein
MASKGGRSPGMKHLNERQANNQASRLVVLYSRFWPSAASYVVVVSLYCTVLRSTPRTLP